MSRFLWSSSARICRMALLSLLALTSCLGAERDDESDAQVVVVGKVTKVAPSPSKEPANRKRWRVTLEIVQIESGSPSVKAGNEATVRVHSVVKEFGDDAKEIVGKRFRIEYKGKFALDYAGDFKATARPEM